MKSRFKDEYEMGTPHQAARGFLTIWGKLMAEARPNNNGTNAAIAREILQEINEDEQRKNQDQPYLVTWEMLAANSKPKKESHSQETAKSPTNSPLPPTAQEVANVIGHEAALALALSSQNRNLYVPKGRLGSDSYLVATIGRERAELLQREFPGMLLPMATCRATKEALIREKMIQLKQQQNQHHANP